MNNRIPGLPAYRTRPDQDKLKSGKSGKFKAFMQTAGKIAGAVGKSVLPLVPGGAVIGAAIDGLSRMGSESGFGANGEMGDGMSPYEMLNLQQKMLQEARTFTVLTNVMKVRHDSAMSAIRNIK